MPSQFDMHNAYSTQLYRGRDASPTAKQPKKTSPPFGAYLFLVVGLAVLLYGVVSEILNLPKNYYVKAEMHLIEKEVGVYDEERGALDYRLKYEYYVDGKPYYYEKISNTTQREVNAPETYLIYYNVSDPNVRRYIDNPSEFKLQYGTAITVGAVLTAFSLLLLFISRPDRPKTPKPPKIRAVKEKKPRQNKNDEDGFFANDTF